MSEQSKDLNDLKGSLGVSDNDQVYTDLVESHSREKDRLNSEIDKLKNEIKELKGNGGGILERTFGALLGGFDELKKLVLMLKASVEVNNKKLDALVKSGGVVNAEQEVEKVFKIPFTKDTVQEEFEYRISEKNKRRFGVEKAVHIDMVRNIMGGEPEELVDVKYSGTVACCSSEEELERTVERLGMETLSIALEHGATKIWVILPEPNQEIIKQAEDESENETNS